MAQDKSKERRTLTGVDFANVSVKIGNTLQTVFIKRGEELPENLAPGALEHLESVGAFNPTTERERKRAVHQRLRHAQEAAGADPNGPLLLPAPPVHPDAPRRAPKKPETTPPERAVQQAGRHQIEIENLGETQ